MVIQIPGDRFCSADMENMDQSTINERVPLFSHEFFQLGLLVFELCVFIRQLWDSKQLNSNM